MGFLSEGEQEWGVGGRKIVLDESRGSRLSLGDRMARMMLRQSSSQGVKSVSLLIFIIGIIYL